MARWEGAGVNALLAQTAGRLTYKALKDGTAGETARLGYMPFGEALERFIGVDPAELPENVKLKRKPPPKRGPGVAGKPHPEG